MAECLSENDLDRYYTGVMGGRERAWVESHLKDCPPCARRRSAYLAAHEKLIGDLRGVELGEERLPLESQGGAGLPPSVDGPSANETEVHPEDHRPRDFIDIEGYRILKELGRGGMGVVYEAIQIKLNRRVALKVLPALAGSANQEAIARFRREATAAAKLHHTHIVPIYDFGESGHTYYYAMELIEGRSLSEMIRCFAKANAPAASQTALAEMIGLPPRTDETLPMGVAASGDDSASSHSTEVGTDTTSRGRVYYQHVAQWMADAADALHHAHSQAIIHRDIKPSNLLLSLDGRIMLLDFGLAKSKGDLSVTGTGSLIGTLRYMSPEQAMAKRMKVDHRTDIYSLGATMYELLVFQPAFKGRDDKETLGMIITRDPPSPRKVIPPVPRDLDLICMRSLEKDPDARFPTARELADELRRYILGLPIKTKRSFLKTVWKFVRRHRAATIAACSMLLLTVAVVFAVSKARQADEEEARARVETVARLIHEGVSNWDAHRWQAAEQKFEEALELDPDNIRGLYNYASAKKDQYNKQRDAALLAEADGLLERALRVDHNSVDIWNTKGVILRMRGRFQDAIDTHRRGVAVDPRHYANLVSLANAYAVSGDVPEAEECLLTAVDLVGEAGGFMPWHNLAAVQLQLSKPEALASLEKALGLGQDKAVTRAAKLLEAKIRLHLAGCIDAQKALAAAITADGLGGLDESDARIKRILAEAHLRRQHWPDAADNAGQALKLNNKAPNPHLILAIAEARLGHGDVAREHLEIATANWPVALQDAGMIATADRGILWFESIADLEQLRTEAEAALASNPP